MRDDDRDNGPKELSENDIELVEGAGVSFGDYAVLSPGVQIILGGREVSGPGE